MVRRAEGGLPSSRLVALLAGDLPGHRLERDARGCRFVPLQGGPALTVTERVERRFLGRTEIAQFRMEIEDPSSAPARLQVRHTGRLKRGGVEVVVDEGDEVAEQMAASLRHNDRFSEATLTLDFTRYDVAHVDGVWKVTVELMGASHVKIALPPMRNYVRLYPDQRDALLNSFEALSTTVRQRAASG